MRIAILSAFLLVGACAAPIGKSTSFETQADTCEAGTTAPCSCGSQSGKKSCQSDNTYASCVCTGGSGPSGSPTLAETVNAGTPSTSTPAPTPTTTTPPTTTTADDPIVTINSSCVTLASCCNQLRAQDLTSSADDCDQTVTANDDSACSSLESTYTDSSFGDPWCTP